MKIIYPDVFATLPKQNTPEPMGCRGIVWMDEDKNIWFTPKDQKLKTVEVTIDR